MVNETTRARLLSRLRSAEGPLSGTVLAEELGLSRVAIWKQLEALREAGYPLVADHSGYRLAGDEDFLYPWEFSRREGRIVYADRRSSTMDAALELALRKPEGSWVVIAETQSAGRGREGRRWSSGPGGLFASVVLRPAIPAWRAERVTLIGLIALAETLRELAGEEFSPKWPNDLCLGGRKVAGLLAEYLVEGTELRFLVLGLGVNVRNPAPGPGALSLAELPGERIPRRRLLSAFLDRFESLELGGFPLAQRWEELSTDSDGPVLRREDDRPLGRARGVDEEGRLRVEFPGGRDAAFRPGEVRLAHR